MVGGVGVYNRILRRDITVSGLNGTRLVPRKLARILLLVNNALNAASNAGRNLVLVI